MQSRWVLAPLAAAVAALVCGPAAAQEAQVNGLGWVKRQPGSELSGSTRATVQGNVQRGGVQASGGKASAGANIGGRVELVPVVQANAIGLQGADARGSTLDVLRNQATGLINAVGGAATVNAVLFAGGAGRQPLADSRILISNNTAGAVDAYGGKADVLLGAGSLQMPGRAAANAVLADGSAWRNSSATLQDNRADRTVSLGGSALANALTTAGSTLDGVRVQQSGNRAVGVRAGGGSGGLGWNVIATADLTGVAAANSVLLANSTLRDVQTLHDTNQAEAVSALGGSALANSVSLSAQQGLRDWRGTLTGNRADEVHSHGGDGAILGGAIADISASATALANSASIQGGTAAGTSRFVAADNTARNVRATGGGSAANSLWVQNGSVRGLDVQIRGNTADTVHTAGGQGNVGGGLVGSFEKNSRALANSVVVGGPATLADAPVVLSGNEAQRLRAAGGTTAANSVALGTDAELRGTRTSLSGNRADGVRATGYEASAGGGLLGAASQQAMALANSLAIDGSRVDAATVSVTGNRASNLQADGGRLQANSISVERDGGAASRLSAPTALAGNEARDIATGASGMAGPGRVFSQTQRARAAVNSVALVDDAQVDAASGLTVSGNRADTVRATGGTVLAQALGAYRGARITASPIRIAGNTTRDAVAGGGSGQVAGMGRAKTGILVANGVYLEAEGGARLGSTPVTIAGNTAETLRADGGRVTANALALNGRGRIDGSRIDIAGNTARRVESQGSEGTVLGYAVIDRGVGHAVANALQQLGTLRGAAVQIAGNTADGVRATQGLAAANSMVAEEAASTTEAPVTIVANQSSRAQASDGKTALAASVANQGSLQRSAVSVTANRADAEASQSDAAAASVRNRMAGRIDAGSATVAANQATVRQGGVAASIDNAGRIGQTAVQVAANRSRAERGGLADGVRNREGGRIDAANVSVMANRGTARNDGVANSLDNSGRLSGGSITILGNNGDADGGRVNSVVNSGTLQGAQITVLGNQGSAQGGGTVNSLRNRGTVAGATISITGNDGSARGGGTVNSVVNERGGSIRGANVMVAGNRGSARGGGTVNSVVNHGQLGGNVAVMGNTGSATMGGTVNSLVNHGLMQGNVVIAGNRGSTMAGGTSNSVINRGVITGTVAIVGNSSAAAVGMTSGSVRNYGGAIVGSAAVTGNVPSIANPGFNYTMPSTGVINQSVTVVPAGSLTNL